MKYDESHGSPYDRGSADAYYMRGIDPHWYPDGTGVGNKVIIEKGTPEYEAYMAGFNDQVESGIHKEYR